MPPAQQHNPVSRNLKTLKRIFFVWDKFFAQKVLGCSEHEGNNLKTLLPKSRQQQKQLERFLFLCQKNSLFFNHSVKKTMIRSLLQVLVFAQNDSQKTAALLKERC